MAIPTQSCCEKTVTQADSQREARVRPRARVRICLPVLPGPGDRSSRTPCSPGAPLPPTRRTRLLAQPSMLETKGEQVGGKRAQNMARKMGWGTRGRVAPPSGLGKRMEPRRRLQNSHPCHHGGERNLPSEARSRRSQHHLLVQGSLSRVQ